MTPDQIQQFNMLQDVITEFSDNPSEKRSVKNSPNAVRCNYNPPTSKPLSRGCAIGMYLPVELAAKLDVLSSTSIEDIINDRSDLLPKWLTDMNVNFLQDVQTLHDDSSYWKHDGLSELGVNHIKVLCVEYRLPFKKLKLK